MAHHTKSRSELFTDLLRGTRSGFIVGLAFIFVSWIAVGLLKLLITWTTGIWPEWFPGQTLDFILTSWWVILIMVSFTVAGAIAASPRLQRHELL